MKKTIKLTEENLVNLIQKIVEQEEDIFIDSESIEDELAPPEIDMEDEEESHYQEILTPEEIAGLMEEQIVQLQESVKFNGELLGDILEYQEYLMQDLLTNPENNLRKSSQKLRALETRSGREIFWLKSRRL